MKMFSRISGAGVLAALSCMLAVGCAEPGFVAYVVTGPPKIEAVHTLDPATTLVIVDDPDNQLGDPNHAAVVGANVGFHLVKNEAIDETLLITQDRLSAYAGLQGDAYHATPIDQVGKALGAKQVVYVSIRSVDLSSKNTYYEPTAKISVKVIDSETGEKLFPLPKDKDAMPDVAIASSEVEGLIDTAEADQPTAGHGMVVQMDRQTLDDNRRTVLSMMARTLAEQCGLEVAQLFYKHTSPERI